MMVAEIPWALIAFGGLVVVATVLVFRGGQRLLAKIKSSVHHGFPFFFWLSLAYLIGLLVVAGLYIGNVFDVKTQIPWLIAGVLPIAVPWFGAVGGAMAGLDGIFWQEATYLQVVGGKWDRSHNYWHIARPVVGAVLAIVAFVFFLVLANSVTSNGATAVPSLTTPVVDLLPFYALAFIVGFRDETFRFLIKAITDLLIGPGQSQPPSGAATQPTIVPPFILQSGGEPITALPLEATIGSPTSATIQVTHESAQLGQVLVSVSGISPPGTSAISVSPETIMASPTEGGGSTAEFTITFAPDAAGQFGAAIFFTATGTGQSAWLPVSGESSS